LAEKNRAGWETGTTSIFLGLTNAGQKKIIFFLGAQPGDKNFLQTNGVFLC
jgi:hypothetical protein